MVLLVLIIQRAYSKYLVSFHFLCHHLGPVMTIIALLASLNSCTNPWIYLFFSGRSCSACCSKNNQDRRGLSRTWTRSTHVVTASYADPDARCRSSVYEMSRNSCSREASPWTRENTGSMSSIRAHSAC